ncbi:MAG: soluble lytic murein transglycosylase [Hyphomicrobiaceae bacterium]|jgi:soluble lytic murein transglycosylase
MLFFRTLLFAILILIAFAPAVPAAEPGRTATTLAAAVAKLKAEPKGAAADFSGLKASAPHLDDVLDFYSAVANVEIDNAKGAALLETFLATYPRSVLREDAAARLASTLEALGRSQALMRLADTQARNEPGTVARSKICLAAGRALIADPKRALVYLDCARRKAPRGQPASVARDLTDHLHQTHPSLAPKGADALWADARLRASEGDTAGRARVLDRFLAEYPGDSRRTTALLSRAKAFETKEAGAKFLEVVAKRTTSPATAAVLVHAAAYTRWNANDDPGALAGFKHYLTLKSSGAEAGLAHYAIGRIHESSGRTDAAILAYERAAAIGSFGRRVESNWRRGWAALRAGRATEAAGLFKKMADAAPKRSAEAGRAEALYWQARALEKAGKPAAARPLFDRVLAEFPDGYYASAVERRRGITAPRLPTQSLRADPSALGSSAKRAWLRARDLGDAGLVALSLKDLEASLKRLSAASRRTLLPTLEGIGASGLAFHQALDLSRRGLIKQAELRPFLYPRAHRGFVEAQSAKLGLDSTIVWSLMRQESAFDAGAVSPAQALGLMQLLESTAARVAPTAGIADAGRERLFDPHTNIALGTTYLAGLLKEFDGRVELALGGYNAGETAAARWQKAGTGMDDDELIESITYRETRDYVKNILRNVRNYRRVWPSN